MPSYSNRDTRRRTGLADVTLPPLGPLRGISTGRPCGGEREAGLALVSTTACGATPDVRRLSNAWNWKSAAGLKRAIESTRTTSPAQRLLQPARHHRPFEEAAAGALSLKP